MAAVRAVAHRFGYLWKMNSSGAALNVSSPGGHGPLWYEYPECEALPYAYVFYLAVKVFNLAMGFPTNVLVMWHIATSKGESLTTDVFIFNLALLDAAFCLMTPVELVNRLYLNLQSIWYLQRFAYGVKDIAPLFLTCICLVRYVAVVHPIFFTSVRDNRPRLAVSFLVWAMLLAYSLADSILGVMAVSQVFTGVILFAFLVMVFCNLSIIWVLRRSVAGKEVMTPVKKKAFKMVLNILAIIVVNYLPAVALMPFASAYTPVQFLCEIIVSVFSIMDLSSTIEPLLYLSKIDKLTCASCLSWAKKKDANVKT